MMTIRTPPAWGDHNFKLSELSAWLNVPVATLDSWLATSRAQGFPPGVMAGRFRWLSGYHIYAAALLTKLRRSGMPISPHHVFSAFTFANEVPQPDAKWNVADSDGVRVAVDAWLTFVAARALIETTP